MADTVTPDPRLDQIRRWLQQDLRFGLIGLEPASADASFRRYFRVRERSGRTAIVMDAPPSHEEVAPYLKVAGLLDDCRVHVPRIEAADLAQGFVLMEDLGSTHYLSRLQAGAPARPLYIEALAALLRIQTHGLAAASQLPAYDEAVLRHEMALMPEWFCVRHLGLQPDAAERSLLEQTFALLVREALAQPTVLVHRDYHSRNLMVLPADGPGVLDFQDALCGPVTYDLVSLMKDCYIAWPREQVRGWLEDYRARLHAAGAGLDADAAELLRWFDLMGLQRHLKVLGIFARLWYRDGKSGYLADLPRTLEYVLDAAGRYSELQEFLQWLERQIVPRLGPANARALSAAAAARGAALTGP